MPLVPAKCTQCGANIQVDSTHEAGICPHCGTAFITEKAVNNYHYQTNINANITQTTNIHAQTVHMHQDEINRFFVIEDGTLIKYNGKLKKIKVPEGVIALGDHVFSRVDYNEVILPSTLLSIGKGALMFDWDADSEGGVRRENIVRRIDLSACTSLCNIEENGLADTSVPVLVLPESLQSIEKNAFAVGQTLCYAGDAAEFEKNFGNSYRKETYYRPPQNYQREFCFYKNPLLGGFRSLGKTDDGYIYALYAEGACLCGYEREIDPEAELRLPATVEGERVVQISPFLYRQLMDVKSLILPEGVTEIPDYALYCTSSLSSLESVYVPASVTKIGKYALAFKRYGQKNAKITFAKGCRLKECDEENYYRYGTQIIEPPILPSGKRDEKIVTVSIDRGVKITAEVYLYDSSTAAPEINASVKTGFTKLLMTVREGEQKSVDVGRKNEAYLVYDCSSRRIGISPKNVEFHFKKKWFGKYELI